MPIQVVCPGCNSVLQVSEELAGKKGRCPKCESVVTIPGADSTHSPNSQRLLRDASPREMVAELFRRNKSAVLAHFDSPAASRYKLMELSNTKIDCVGTEDMDVDQLRQVLNDLSKLSESKGKNAIDLDTKQEQQHYELKGDQLGMRLADFQVKHARNVGGQSISLPWCSNTLPNQKVAALLAEEWHTEAGIVHARLDLPFESNSPTIGGVATELLLYQFVDEQLFRITAFFETESIHLIHESIKNKYGPAHRETNDPRKLFWSNELSSIELIRGTIRPKAASMLHFIHAELMYIADARQPSQVDDI